MSNRTTRPTLFRHHSTLRQYLTLGVIAVLGASAVWNNVTDEKTQRAGSAKLAEGEYLLVANVERVVDGDTIYVRTEAGQHRIRMASIDAPETQSGPHRPGQPYGQQSRAFLASLINNKPLTLHCFEQDNHGRDVCDVYVDEGVSLNEQMVAAGYAWANTEKQGLFLRNGNVVELQQKVRSQKQGLWQEKGAKAPWVWRYECWNQGKC